MSACCPLRQCLYTTGAYLAGGMVMLVLSGLACTLFSFGLWPFETAAL